MWQTWLYPVNAMRNRALAAAGTDVVLQLDVDFWPSPEVSDLVLNATKYAGMLAAVGAGQAVVLPSFETDEAGFKKLTEELLEAGQAPGVQPGSKEAAVALLQRGHMISFHGYRYSLGHRATNSSCWAETSQPYIVQHEEVGGVPAPAAAGPHHMGQLALATIPTGVMYLSI